MAHDVFVSYSSKDQLEANMVVAALEQQGVRCWVAPRDLLVGQEWAEGILRGISGSKLLVLVFSDHTNNSTHVRKEVERAVHHGLAVAPIRITKSVPADALEYFLSSSHWLDAMTPPLEKHLAELTRKVLLLLKEEAATPVASMPPGEPVPTPLPVPVPVSVPVRSPRPPKEYTTQRLLVGLALILSVAVAAFLAARFGRPYLNPVAATKPLPGAGSPATTPASSPPEITSVPVPMTIDVSTPAEFIAAIGPNRTIRLKPGEYVLTEVPETKMEFIRWDREYDGSTVIIRNVKHLAIVGQGNQPVRLIVRPRHTFVLKFDMCEDIRLDNLVLGHAPNLGTCKNGVLGVSDCTGIKLSYCDLFGCGTEGLTLNNVNDFKFVESTVRDCTYGIMTLQACTNLEFKRSHFVGNSKSWGIQIDDSKNIVFSDCDIEKNKLQDGSLFRVVSSANIAFSNGVIRDNEATRLMEDADTVSFTRTFMGDNKFQKQ